MPDVKTKANAALLASLTGDAISLGPHWIYNAAVIKQSFGDIDGLTAPGPDSFHKNRTSGDFTHYGDQTMVLLESVAEQGKFELKAFFDAWNALFDSYDGYIDGATRNTRARIDFGEGPDTSGANSHDLAGASRIAPLAPVYAQDLDALVAAAKEQTKMTHNNPLVIDAAVFFARTVHAVLHGQAPTSAMEQAAGQDYMSAPVGNWFSQGMDMAATDSTAAIAKLGLSCNIEGAFPGTVQLIARYENDLPAALCANAMAGGDSAARGLLVGMVLGAHCGEQAIPDQWTLDINRIQTIRECISKLR